MSSSAKQTEFIDVRQRIEGLSVEQLCAGAEGFFAERANWDSLLAKPLSDIEEAPELLVCFAHVVRGLNLLPDMTVLDFGAGSCWTSRFLTQLGMKVIALDVSPSALRIGKKLFRRHPVIGNKPRAEFLLFDGRAIDMPDASVDRITCWEAFHHVPNPKEVIGEMGRVLKPGGIAGFSEPGPDHSKSEQSQIEMQEHGVIENDVDVREIWRIAQPAGFTRITLAVFNTEPVTLSLNDFEGFMIDGDAGAQVNAELRAQMHERRLFFLHKGERDVRIDSRQRDGLSADLTVTAETTRVTAGQSLRLRAKIKNTGSAVWLPTPEASSVWWKKGPLSRVGQRRYMGPDRLPPRVGGVRFAIQLLDQAGRIIDIDYFRYHLTSGEGREIAPDESIELALEVPMIRAGRYLLKCQLVSEFVCWFETVGSHAVIIPVEILP